jgi:hypothetical protein
MKVKTVNCVFFCSFTFLFLATAQQWPTNRVYVSSNYVKRGEMCAFFSKSNFNAYTCSIKRTIHVRIEHLKRKKKNKSNKIA